MMKQDSVVTVGEIRDAFIGGHSAPPSPDPDARLVIRGGTLVKCKHDGNWVNGARIEDIEIDGLTSSGRLKSWLRGCIFSNVTIRGVVSGISLQSEMIDHPDLQPKYTAQAEEFYRKVSLALDISEAKFKDFTILEGVPPRLIRRNPELHFILRAEYVAQVRKLNSTLSVVALAAREAKEGVVFVSGRRTEKNRELWDQFSELRTRGLLE